jgi:alpha-methylacyl-CoA racemase
MSGPLTGVRIVEVAGIGPGPFCAMLLADMGADVIRVDRPAPASGPGDGPPAADVLQRGRRSIAVDLKTEAGVDVVLALAERADGLLEGFRPGVAERLGIGPEPCLARNGRLVYGRMTGWGQDGPYSPTAGHDINYIALAGALWPMGLRDRPPTPPLNLIGDFGGGGMLLAFGMVSALFEAQRSGRGQVVDAAMVDGSAVLTTMIHGFRAMGQWVDERQANLIDGGAHFYGVYETADGGYVALGSIEPQFYAELLARLGLDPAALPPQHDRSAWPALRARLEEIFRRRTRAEWCEVFEGADACFAPVLTMAEAPRHPHNAARETFVEIAGVVQPAPAPRFSRTPGAVQRPPARPGQHTAEILEELGLDPDHLSRRRAS